MKEIDKLCIKKGATVKEAIAAIQGGHVGIALVIDDERRLLWTITDGDIRRAILKNIDLGANIHKLAKLGCISSLEPTTSSIRTSKEAMLRIMKHKGVRHLPLLDEKGRVKEIALLTELIDYAASLPLTAIVMAGGKGQRLFPFTQHMPKPMLPLQGKPLMERTIEQLRNIGIKKVNIATHYKSELITGHFGDGATFGVDINYINEDQPLGTAGALGLMQEPSETTLILNGDIVTNINFEAMHDFHVSQRAVMTVAVRKCELEVPYGVIDLNDITIKNVIEKPVQAFIVNAGIYLLEPLAYQYIPKKRHYNMTDLVNKLIKAGHKVICFPIQEYWLDVGHPITYEQAKEDAKNGKI